MKPMKYLLRIENTILLEKTSISQEVEILTYYQSLNSQFFTLDVPTRQLNSNSHSDTQKPSNVFRCVPSGTNCSQFCHTPICKALEPTVLRFFTIKTQPQPAPLQMWIVERCIKWEGRLNSFRNLSQ